MIRTFLLLAAAAGLVFAQKYDGPQPPKPDLPYLKHATTLVPTEAASAIEEKRKKKDEQLYIIEGKQSTARTPLASPTLIILADKVVPDRLGLFKLDVKGGHREILFRAKKQTRQLRIEVNRISGKLFQIEVVDSLEPGEYSLSPDGSNQVFCFAVY